MEKETAIALIDKAKENLINPVEMLDWVWLRVIILNMDQDAWNAACENAANKMR